MRKANLSVYQVQNISAEASFLEMLDILNERLVVEGEDPVAFDHDCREGICGACTFISMAVRTGQTKASRPVKCICVVLRMAKQL